MDKASMTCGTEQQGSKHEKMGVFTACVMCKLVMELDINPWVCVQNKLKNHSAVTDAQATCPEKSVNSGIQNVTL